MVHLGRLIELRPIDVDPVGTGLSDLAVVVHLVQVPCDELVALGVRRAFFQQYLELLQCFRQQTRHTDCHARMRVKRLVEMNAGR